jgi:hypothetical protein
LDSGIRSGATTSWSTICRVVVHHVEVPSVARLECSDASVVCWEPVCCITVCCGLGVLSVVPLSIAVRCVGRPPVAVGSAVRHVVECRPSCLGIPSSCLRVPSATSWSAACRVLECRLPRPGVPPAASWSAACRVLECRLPRLGVPPATSWTAIRRVFECRPSCLGVPLPPRRVLECRLPLLAVPVRHVLGSSRCVVS